jgi:hypothetical protein
MRHPTTSPRQDDISLMQPGAPRRPVSVERHHHATMAAVIKRDVLQAGAEIGDRDPAMLEQLRQRHR